ncbi:ferredoxin [Mycoplasmatota bacterium]|nr:ferredoxin [Mycoplasmatota bacterium]
MKALVNKDTCIGCELCPSICPDIFRMDDDGLAVAEDTEISDELMSEVKEAEDSCPVAAITIEDM